MAIKSHISFGRFASLNNNEQNNIGVNSIISQLYKLYNQYNKNYIYMINQWNTFCDLNNIDKEYKLNEVKDNKITTISQLDEVQQKINEFDMRLGLLEQLAKSDTRELCNSEWIFYLRNPIASNKASVATKIKLTERYKHLETIPSDALSYVTFYRAQKEAFIFKKELTCYISTPSDTMYEIFSEYIKIPKDISYSMYLGKMYAIENTNITYGEVDLYLIISGKKHGKPITDKYLYIDDQNG